jgi:hypothetical protein
VKLSVQRETTEINQMRFERTRRKRAIKEEKCIKRLGFL